MLRECENQNAGFGIDKLHFCSYNTTVIAQKTAKRRVSFHPTLQRAPVAEKERAAGLPKMVSELRTDRQVALGCDGFARYSKRVCWYPQRLSLQGGSEQRW